MLNKVHNNILGMKIAEFEAFVGKYPEFEPIFEYVRGSYRMAEHYRFIPETRWTPTQAQLYTRLEFTLASYNAYGSKGFDELDGGFLPVVAVAVAKRMRGKKYTKKTPLTESPSFLSRIKKRLKRGMIQEPSKLKIKKLKRIAYGEEEFRPQGEPLRLPMEVKPEKEKIPSLTYEQVGYYAKILGDRNLRIMDDIFSGRRKKRKPLQ